MCANAVAIHLRNQRLLNASVLIGYDTRFLSKEFALQAAQGLANGGIRNIAMGETPVPTPALSLGVVQGGHAIGIMITASHNPAIWNGFKVKSAKGGSASPKEVSAIESCLKQARFSMDNVYRSDFPIEHIDLLTPYVDVISELVDIDAIRDAGLSVAVDSMHGSGAGVISRALGGGKTTVAELRSDVNPAFPGMKQPEPIGDNLTQLSDFVSHNGCDVGLATDGDADRLGVIDERGTYLTTLEVFSMLFHHLKARRSASGGAASTITMSSMVDILAAHHDSENIRTPVGFKFVGPAMLENGCALGGEESGGYAFAGHIPERDGPLSALMFLESMALTGMTPSELLAEVHEITGPRTFKRIDSEFDPDDRDRISGRISQDVKPDSFGPDATAVDRTDGLRVEYRDASWGVARMSGTEPLVRIYAEAPTTDKRDGILQDLSDYLGISPA